MSDILIIRCKEELSPEQMETYHKVFCDQKRMYGTVLLPSMFEAIVVPDGVKIEVHEPMNSDDDYVKLHDIDELYIFIDSVIKKMPGPRGGHQIRALLVRANSTGLITSIENFMCVSIDKLKRVPHVGPKTIELVKYIRSKIVYMNGDYYVRKEDLG